MNALPQIMIAPNGARRSKQDHPALPITIPETVATARDCFHAGANGLHLHVRGSHGEHSLDAGLYREAIAELKIAVPNMMVQITTEAVGIYSPQEQQQVVRDVKPNAVSIAIVEMLAHDDHAAVIDFYNWCNQSKIKVQHILYSPEDSIRLEGLLSSLTPTLDPVQILFVLGRYTKNQQSKPADILPFTDWLSTSNLEADWSICAFGKAETRCLKASHEAGGKMRIGFENSFWNDDGSLARDNVERILDLKKAIS